MMPALSAAISPMVSPRIAMWSRLTGVMTLTSGVTTLVASQPPAQSDLDHADVDRILGEALETHGGQVLEQRRPGRRRDRRRCPGGYGQTASVSAANRSRETGCPSRRMRSQKECRCGDE